MGIGDAGQDKPKDMLAKLVVILGAATAGYTVLYISRIPGLLGIIIYPQVHFAIFLLVSLVLVFILHRANSGDHSSRVPWYDWVLVAGSIVSIGYIIVASEVVIGQMLVGYATPLQSVLFCVAVVVILEGTRRTTGLPLMIITLGFLLQVFLCNHLPGLLYGRGYDLDRVAFALYLGAEGIFGMPLRIIATVVFGFLVFSQFLLSSGAGETFIRLPMALVGSVRGGPAKVAVLGSALMGMVSGSAIGNVAGTGVFTIPLMKSVGYNSNFAGAVEAVASTGGQITPPVLGGAIFLMADWLGLPYIYLCFVWALPALLYYFNVYMVVDFEAARSGLKGLPRESLPSIKKVVKGGWIYFIPLILLMYLLAVLRLPAEIAAIGSVVSIVLVSLFKKGTRMGPGKLVDALDASFKQALMIIMAVGSAGIIMGCLGITGIGVKMSASFIQLSGGNLPVLLTLATIAAFVMGMGMPIAPIYIILAVILAPTLVMAGVPELAAHAFVVVASLLSLITPPVALCAYAAVAISGGDIMKTGIQATRLGAVLFLLPFWFVYRPAILLLGTPVEIVVTLLAALTAILALSSGVMGYGLTGLRWFERTLLLVGALLLIPPGAWNIAGFALIALIAAEQAFLKRAEAQSARSPRVA